MLTFEDVAEVVLYRCVQRIQNEKGEVTAIEMSFDYLDDFQDPPGGTFHRFHQALYGSGSDQVGFTELSTTISQDQKSSSQPVEFDRSNHVLQWMVRAERMHVHTIHHDINIYTS